MKILIKVTKDVLRKAMMCGDNSASNCAIAVASIEILGDCQVSYTNEGKPAIYYYPKSLDVSSVEIPLPMKAKEFMLDFDMLRHTPHERLLLPEQSFEVTLPDRVIQEIGIGEAYRVLSESKTLELVM